MAQFNPDFWEVPTSSEYIENVPADRAMWFETNEDRQRRYALQEFFQSVLPLVTDLIELELTTRQCEVVRLYYFMGKTQEDVAAILDLSQSTVSRHLFGTVRNGRRVGGAIPKLRKVMDRRQPAEVGTALGQLRTRLAEAI